MWYNDRHRPHFHVHYAGVKASFEIEGMQLLEGNLPTHVLNLVVRWTALHQSELLDNWERMRSRKPVLKIEPLE